MSRLFLLRKSGVRPIIQRYYNNNNRIPHVDVTQQQQQQQQRWFSAPATMHDMMCDDLRQRLAKLMETKDSSSAASDRKMLSDADLQDRVQAFQVCVCVYDFMCLCLYVRVFVDDWI